MPARVCASLYILTCSSFWGAAAVDYEYENSFSEELHQVASTAVYINPAELERFVRARESTFFPSRLALNCADPRFYSSRRPQQLNTPFRCCLMKNQDKHKLGWVERTGNTPTSCMEWLGQLDIRKHFFQINHRHSVFCLTTLGSWQPQSVCPIVLLYVLLFYNRSSRASYNR